MTPTRRALIAGSLGLALLAGCVLAWHLGRSPVREADVAAFLDKAAGAGRVRFSDLHLGVTRLGDAELQVSVVATARAPWPLYSRLDATDYLRDALKVDPGSTAEARRLVEEEAGPKDPLLERLRPLPADPYRAVVLQATAQAGAAFPYQALIAAHRSAEGWTFVLVSGSYGNGEPRGDPQGTFGDGSFVAGDARDDARLRALAADFQAFAARAAGARRSLEATHAAQVDARRAAFLSRIAPGSVFKGTAVRGREAQATVLYLQITGLAEGNSVTALLRNAGGWHDARPFQGTWTADDEFQQPTLHLASQPDQAVWNGGPYLENTQPWAFALRMDPSGALLETNRLYQYAFRPLDPAQTSLERAALSAEYDRARAASRAGLLYRGTAASKEGGASEPLLLRFAGSPTDTAALTGQFESTTRSWRRAFSGEILGNARRSEGAPLRLHSAASDAVEQAGADSVLGNRSDLDLRLGLENGALAGEDARYTYRFAPEGAGDLEALNSTRAALAARLRSALREGVSYDGTVRDDQGSVNPVRLEIVHVDRQRGAIAAAIHSLAVRDIYQNFIGGWDPADPSLTLAATGKGAFDSSDSVAVPFLVAPVAATLQLALAGNAITGGIRGNPHWVIEVPVGFFLASAAGAAGPGAEQALPALPAAAGAYLLDAGAWTPLPHNNGHVVVETSHGMNEEEQGLGMLGLVSSGVRRIANKGEKATYLEFDGKDPVPDVPLPAFTLLIVGSGGSPEAPVEVAAVEKVKDGRRRIEVEGRPNAGVRFGEQRVAAYVRPAGGGAVLFTPTAPLPPGSYALNALAGYEFSVR